MGISTSGSTRAQLVTEVSTDELQLVIAVNGVASNSRAAQQSHGRSHKLKKRKLSTFHCLVRAEIFSQEKVLYCQVKEATITTTDDGEFIFAFILDEPFMIGATSLLIRQSKSPGTGWIRSLAQEYTVTVSLLFNNDTDMNDALRVADLRPNEEEITLASTFRISDDALQDEARRAQLKQYVNKISTTTNLNMVCNIRWKGYPVVCGWCHEGFSFPTKALCDLHEKTVHPLVADMRTTSGDLDSDNISTTEAKANDNVKSEVKKQPTSPESTTKATSTMINHGGDTNGKTDTDIRRPSANSVKGYPLLPGGNIRLLDVINGAWKVTYDDLATIFGQNNLTDPKFIKVLSELAEVTSLQAGKAAISDSRRKRHQNLDLKLCNIGNVQDAIDTLWQRSNLQRLSLDQPTAPASNVGVTALANHDTKLSDQAVRVSKVGSGKNTLAKERGLNGLSNEKDQSDDDVKQTTSFRQLLPRLDAAMKVSPFQAARSTSISFGIGDRKTGKTTTGSSRSKDKKRHARRDRDARVIPESPSFLEELLDTRRDLRVDSGIELDETPILPQTIRKFTKGVANLMSNGIPAEISIAEAKKKSKSSELVLEQPRTVAKPWAVHGLPQPRTTIYTVPSRSGHNLRLFEETTFRPLISGTQVTDHEFQIDETWLRMKQDQKIEAYSNMSSVQQALMKRWNHQMLEEKLNGNKFLPEATMRFVAANKSWLEQDLAFSEFIRFIGALRADKLISDVVIKACTDALRGTKLSRKDLVEPVTTRAKMRASLNIATSSKIPSPKTFLSLPEVPEAPYVLEKRSDWAAVCICGETVDCAGQIVLCSNPVSLCYLSARYTLIQPTKFTVRIVPTQNIT